MAIGRLNLIAGGLLALLGLVVAAAGPGLGPAFGVESFPAPGGGGADVPAEWRLVAFTRMFGMAVLLCGALLLGVGSHLRRERVRTFAWVVAGASTLTALMALVQQTAIWNTPTGAAVPVVFGLIALAYGWTAIRADPAVRDLSDVDSAPHRTTTG